MTFILYTLLIMVVSWVQGLGLEGWVGGRPHWGPWPLNLLFIPLAPCILYCTEYLIKLK